MNWTDYREQLNIGFNDEERIAQFENRILNWLEHVERLGVEEYSTSESFFFFYIVGEDICLYDGYHSELRKIIAVLKKHKDSLEDFISYYMAFIHSLSDERKIQSKEDYLKVMEGAFNASNLRYRLISEGEMSMVFPEGAKELDDALIAQPLDWIRDYPKARKEWIEALKKYDSSNNYSDVADTFRKALETFFQEFFGGNKNLENYKSTYGGFLKEAGIPGELANNFESTLQAYTHYMNNHAKHGNTARRNALEYIMYQTGNIMRLLLSLHNAN